MKLLPGSKKFAFVVGHEVRFPQFVPGRGEIRIRGFQNPGLHYSLLFLLMNSRELLLPGPPEGKFPCYRLVGSIGLLVYLEVLHLVSGSCADYRSVRAYRSVVYGVPPISSRVRVPPCSRCPRRYLRRRKAWLHRYSRHAITCERVVDQDSSRMPPSTAKHKGNCYIMFQTVIYKSFAT